MVPPLASLFSCRCSMSLVIKHTAMLMGKTCNRGEEEAAAWRRGRRPSVKPSSLSRLRVAVIATAGRAASHDAAQVE